MPHEGHKSITSTNSDITVSDFQWRLTTAPEQRLLLLAALFGQPRQVESDWSDADSGPN
jgi:hypothetical protein